MDSPARGREQQLAVGPAALLGGGDAEGLEPPADRLEALVGGQDALAGGQEGVDSRVDSRAGQEIVADSRSNAPRRSSQSLTISPFIVRRLVIMLNRFGGPGWGLLVIVAGYAAAGNDSAMDPQRRKRRLERVALPRCRSRRLSRRAPQS
jgi:hypothetical protein